MPPSWARRSFRDLRYGILVRRQRTAGKRRDILASQVRVGRLDHREQAQALMMLIEERATHDGWHAARLVPLLAGLAEVRQWHGEVDPAFGQSPADAYAMYLENEQRRYGIVGRRS